MHQEDSLRVLYISVDDARDPRAWSGIPHRVATELAGSSLHVDLASPLKRSKLDPIWAVFQRLRNTLIRSPRYLRTREPALLRAYSRQIEAAVARTQPDVILATSTIPIAYLTTDVPLVLWGGSTFKQMENYYSDFSNLSPRTSRTFHEMENRALSNCDIVVLASDWAREGALRDYGLDSKTVHVLPWGGVSPVRQTSLDEIRGRLKRPCRLLVVGGDWHRKGLDEVCEVVSHLRDRGLATELTVVGVEPPSGQMVPPGVNIIPRLDRSKETEREQLDSLYRDASYLVALSRAEAYGQVVNESSAASLPVIASNTGGLTDAVVDGVNGWLVDSAIEPADLALMIVEKWSDQRGYIEMCRAARTLFEEERSWETVLARLRGILRQAAGEFPGGSASVNASTKT